MLKSPKLRLAGRALIAGLIAAGVSIKASGYSTDKTAVYAAAGAGILAFCEVFTPLNAVVGYFKGNPDGGLILVADLLNVLGNPTAATKVSKDDVIAAAKKAVK